MIDDAQLEALPVDEKLRLVTSLWDQIARSGQPITLPNAMFGDAERRIEEMKNDSASCLSEDEMWRQANDRR